MSVAAGTLPWFARHEARLAWRDMLSFLTGGRRRSLRAAVLWILAVEIVLHLVAFGALSGATVLAEPPTGGTLVLVTGLGFFALALMLAQAMETVTRVVYGRSDLDLVLSSPARASRLFALRTGMTALGTTAMALFLVGPFVTAAAVLHRPGWLMALVVVAAMGATAAALAILFTLALFRLLGPGRTRMVAQVVAAVIGAGFVIGGQAAGVIWYGDVSRIALLASPDVLALAPGPGSWVWWPARAAAGDVCALAAVAAVAFPAFLVAVALAGRALPAAALAASDTASGGRRARVRVARLSRFAAASPRAHLRGKELRLLARDPWLISQSLMQVLYLLPPALLLWLNFGRAVDMPAVLVPILVMAAGQLAGGLAWLTISGEDAPDLVATAPVPPATAIRAKVEAVAVAVAVPLALPLALLHLAAPVAALAATLAVLGATASATLIQFLFRSAARRSHFRRRQTASRIATFAEAFSSISWAATGGIAAAGSLLAAVPLVVALAVLAAAALASPRRDG